MNFKLEFLGYNEKNMLFHVILKKYYLWLSPGEWECNREHPPLIGGFIFRHVFGCFYTYVMM